jgi:hypothetical protein
MKDYHTLDMTQIKVKEQLQNVGCPTVADTLINTVEKTP